MSRRISGVDINGWRDVAARDWSPMNSDRTVVCVDGGVGSVAVAEALGGWIGGPQAALAPHGRGPGWGDIGNPDRRLQLRDALGRLAEAGPDARSALKACVEAIARGANNLILAVPDTAQFDEQTRDAILSTLPGHRLLWRPVAAFLGAMEGEQIAPAANGASFDFLIHAGGGLEFQSLRLRHDPDHGGHYAPEREGTGRLILPQLGLTALLARVTERLLEANPHLREEAAERPTLPLRCLMGIAHAGDVEILRHDRGTWLECTAPHLDPTALMGGVLDGDPPPRLSAAQVTFLLTPLAEPVREHLRALLAPFFPGLAILPWDSVARGCLLAGRLIDRGLPHYFDRLTPIALAVFDAGSGEPAFEDLIGSEATVPANREFVSPPYDKLRWGRAKNEISFYVLKGELEVRHWKIAMPEGPPRDVPIELRLRQTPGQSWARLVLTSPDWDLLARAPVQLDWAILDPIPLTPEEVLVELRTPPPIIPRRVIEEAHMEFWDGNANLRSLADAVRSADTRSDRWLNNIEQMLPRSSRDPQTYAKRRAVNSDGQIPAELELEVRNRFAHLIELAAARVLAGTHVLSSNRELRILTWTFTFCPDAVQDLIVEAVEAYALARGHRLHQGALQRRTVLIQGSGRAVTGEARLRRLLRALVALPTNSDTMNALGMIMSRREAAPKALDGALVRALARKLNDELGQLLRARSFKTRFFNTLSALAGLFRYREIERASLLRASDPLADEIHGKIAQIILCLEHTPPSHTRAQATRSILLAIQTYLEGGGDPDILTKIDTADVSEDGGAG